MASFSDMQVIYRISVGIKFFTLPSPSSHPPPSPLEYQLAFNFLPSHHPPPTLLPPHCQTPYKMGIHKNMFLFLHENIHIIFILINAPSLISAPSHILLEINMTKFHMKWFQDIWCFFPQFVLEYHFLELQNKYSILTQSTLQHTYFFFRNKEISVHFD